MVDIPVLDKIVSLAKKTEIKRVERGLSEEQAIALFVGSLNMIKEDLKSRWANIDYSLSLNYESESYFWMIRRLRNYPEFWHFATSLGFESLSKRQSEIESKVSLIADRIQLFGFDEVAFSKSERGEMHFLGTEESSGEKALIVLDLFDLSVRFRLRSWKRDDDMIVGVIY